jgi:quercetin dioxygenase-like cupin family protein
VLAESREAQTMNAKVVRKEDAPPEETDWGSLQWLVCAANGASARMTFGRVTLRPGEANPMHSHPNCEEILFVVSGQVEHSLPEGGTAHLGPGDCIVLPEGSPHQARNVGSDEAVVVVAFSSAERETLGE